MIKKVANKLVQFEIRLVADPKPEIEWYFKKKLIVDKHQFESSKYKTQFVSNRHNHLASLTFLSLDPLSDAGQYLFVARNHLGSVESVVSLEFDRNGSPITQMAVAPRFPKKPTIRQNGNVLILECVLEADPYPEITWFHGTNTITDGGRHKITKKENGGNMYTLGLEITNPTLEDGGTYRCNAVNVKGESNANIALNFQSNSIHLSGLEIFFLEN